MLQLYPVCSEFIFCDSECDCIDCSDENEHFCQNFPTGFTGLCPNKFVDLHGEFISFWKRFQHLCLELSQCSLDGNVSSAN